VELRHFSLERYKGYARRAEVALAPLTILIGSNNAGRTALAQAIPLLAGGLAPTDADAQEPLPLESCGIQSTPRIGPLEISPGSEGSVGYLLDGQQRVSTLAGTLRLTDDMDPIVDHIDWRVYYDLDDQTFVDHRKLPRDSDPRYFPVRSLLNTAGFFEACRRIQDQVDDERRALRWLDEADLSLLGTDAVGYVWSNPDPPELVSSPANRLFVDEDHVGQALRELRELSERGDDALGRVLKTHGFPIDCIGQLRSDDRAGLIDARLATLIDGERTFMVERGVTLPAEQTAPAIADSESSDDE